MKLFTGILDLKNVGISLVYRFFIVSLLFGDSKHDSYLEIKGGSYVLPSDIVPLEFLNDVIWVVSFD